MLAWAGESQYYTEPKRLAALGYLDARREPGRTRPRTVYTLTEKGLDALCDYARTPVAFTPLNSDVLLRLRARPENPPLSRPVDRPIATGTGLRSHPRRRSR